MTATTHSVEFISFYLCFGIVFCIRENLSEALSAAVECSTRTPHSSIVPSVSCTSQCRSTIAITCSRAVWMVGRTDRWDLRESFCVCVCVTACGVLRAGYYACVFYLYLVTFIGISIYLNLFRIQSKSKLKQFHSIRANESLVCSYITLPPSIQRTHDSQKYVR